MSGTTSTNLAQRPIDVLVRGLCESNAELRERCQALEALAVSRGDDAASAQLLARQALHALHREQQAHDRLRERYERLVTEYRDHRRRAMPRATEAAA
jgi:hypothetical protein